MSDFKYGLTQPNDVAGKTGREITSAEARVLAANGSVLAHVTSTLLVQNGLR